MAHRIHNGHVFRIYVCRCGTCADCFRLHKCVGFGKNIAVQRHIDSRRVTQYVFEIFVCRVRIQHRNGIRRTYIWTENEL